jgi:4-hydroxy-3-methylbut-2-enyl diphosphate reductase
MKVIRAKVLGFCMGVRRAVELAKQAAGTPVYMLGPIVHNPKVLQELMALGIEPVNEPEQLPVNSSLIIRAHGISPQKEENLRNSGFKIIDATCPKVKASQLKAQNLARIGFFLFLAGEAAHQVAHHAEIEGILGYAHEGTRDSGTGDEGNGGGIAVVVGNAAEAQKAAAKLYETNKNAKTALLGQTTISEEEYAGIGYAIKKYFPDIEIMQTICAATADRQDALRELLNLVDAVVVAGGKESANTRRLFAIAKESGKPCVLAEKTQDIPESFFSCKTAGICAGASTPDSTIDEIEFELLRKKNTG